MQDAGEGGGARTPLRLRDEIDTWVFDLDDTLYPRTAGLYEQMHGRVVLFIQGLVGCDAAEAAALHAQYYERYGTSLIGLNKHHGVAPQDFLAFVHDIDITPVGSGAALAAALARLPGRRLVFTNGSVRHARRILTHLGVADLFEAVCDIEACNYVGKPARAAYETLLADHKVDPARSIMFDDRPVNLQVPHALGMQTVLVTGGRQLPGADGAHVHGEAQDVPSFLDRAFPARS